MTPEEAKEICIQAHTGQYRRPVEMDYRDVSELINRPPLNKEDFTFPDGSKLDWDDLVELWYYYTPYHTHPIAVADMMDTDEEKIVAYLHDVLEDTYVTYTDIKNQFGIEIAQEVLLLTKEHDDYGLYIGCLSQNKRTTKAKIADITHNLSCNPSDRQKIKYLKAMKILLASL